MDILIRDSIITKLTDLEKALKITRNLFEPRISRANNFKYTSLCLIGGPCTIVIFPAVVATSSALLAGSGVTGIIRAAKETGVLGGASGVFFVACCCSLSGLSKIN